MFRLTGLFLFLTLTLSSYAQTNKEKAMNNVKQALILQDHGKPDEAIKLLEDARHFDAETSTVSYELAIAYYSKGEYEKARVVLDSLTKHKDAFGNIYQLLGNCYDKQGNTEKAIATYLDGVTKFPNTGELYLEMGTMFLSRKEYNPAIGWYEKGIEMNPGLASNYYWAAKIYCNSDNAVWGMLYGEIFLLLERDTKRTDEVSKLLYDTYKKDIRFPRDSSFAVRFSSRIMPGPGDTSNGKKSKIPFAKSVYEPTLMLALLSEKSVDLNSLCRVRKYFIESWFRNLNYQKYPNVLFDFQYRALKAGHIDAYNHYVLYKGDETACNKWISANKSKWENFMKWFTKNQLLLDTNYRFIRKQYD